MRNPVILNIGLAAHSDLFEACRAMRRAGIVFDTAHLRLSPTDEYAMVVMCDATDDRIHAVSEALEEDCIAVWDLMHREGRLIGPKAAEWGEFDPTLFIMRDGRTLAAHQEEYAQ